MLLETSAEPMWEVGSVVKNFGVLLYVYHDPDLPCPPPALPPTHLPHPKLAPYEHDGEGSTLIKVIMLETLSVMEL